MRRLFVTLVTVLWLGVLGQTQPADQTTTGTVTSTTCPGTGCVRLATAGMSSVSIEVTGTWVGTLQFEAVVGSTWVSVDGWVPVTGANVTSTTANGTWTFRSGSMAAFRVRASAYTSGTATVVLRGSAGVSVAQVNVGSGGGGGGGLTDVQLRASPVPVSGTVTTGGLTDTQLRATPVPISGTAAVTNAGLTNLDVALSTRTKPADQQHAIVDSGTTTVTQATGTNLHTVVDSAPTTAVTIASVPSHPVTNAGTFAVQVSSAPTTAVTNAGLTNLDVALSTRLKPADTLAAVTTITNPVAVTSTGLTNLDVALSTRTKPSDQQHTIIDSGTTGVTQPTAANLNATVAQGAASTTPWNTQVPDVASSQAISTTTCAAGITNQTGCVIVAAAGRSGWMVSWPTASTFVGVMTAEASNDAGVTWIATFFDAPSTSTKSATISPASGVAGVFSLVPVGGATFYRVRATTATSGSGTFTLTSVADRDPSALFAGPNNTAMPPTVAATGGEAISPGSQPTAATSGNLRRILTTTEGVQVVQEGSSNRFSCFVQGVTVTTQCQAAPAAGLRNYVTSVTLSNQAATVQTLDLVFGTGAACVTGTTALTHKWQFGTVATTTSPFVVAMQFTTPLVPTAANAICVRPSAATAFGATITGYVAP